MQATPELREHYVYVIFRPNGVPCYVGIGKKGRWRVHFKNSHNFYLRALIKKVGDRLPVVKIKEKLSRKEACDIEIALIRALGRKEHGGLLFNMTDGGEGASGYIATAEECKRISKLHKGKVVSEETRAKLSAAHKGKKLSEETKAKLRGRTASTAARAKMRAAALGQVRSAETRAKMSLARRSRQITKAQCEIMSIQRKGKKLPIAHAHKIAATWASKCAEKAICDAAQINEHVKVWKRTCRRTYQKAYMRKRRASRKSA